MKLFLLSLVCLILIPLYACASEPVRPGLFGVSSLGGFWQGFRTYWMQQVGSVNGIVLVVVILGAVGIFIITRGKWLK